MACTEAAAISLTSTAVSSTSLIPEWDGIWCSFAGQHVTQLAGSIAQNLATSMPQDGTNSMQVGLPARQLTLRCWPSMLLSSLTHVFLPGEEVGASMQNLRCFDVAQAMQ